MMIVIKPLTKKRLSNPQNTKQPEKSLPRHTSIDYKFKTCNYFTHPRLFLCYTKTLLSIDLQFAIHHAKQKSDSTISRLQPFHLGSVFSKPYCQLSQKQVARLTNAPNNEAIYHICYLQTYTLSQQNCQNRQGNSPILHRYYKKHQNHRTKSLSQKI